MLPSLKNLSDKLLLSNVKNLKGVENRTLADLVLYLAEVDQRKLYREAGYPSLYNYCTEGLGYSGGAAFRRMQAARCLEANPEIYELIKEGKLSLCSVAEISKVIKPENKVELLEVIQGKPKAEVQKIAVRYQDAVTPSRLKEKVVARKVSIPLDPLFHSPDESTTKEELQFTFTVAVDSEFMDLLKEAKDIVGFVPTPEILKRTLKEFVSKRKAAPRKAIEPGKLAEKAPAAVTKPPAASRYIPKAVAFTVKERDHRRCTFVSSDGRRCSETCGLQLDHIKPFALGGSHEASNLRLLCSAHNQLFAERSFGKAKIESYFHRGSRG